MGHGQIPVLVTRAAPGADDTMRRLKARGLKAIRSPMLSQVRRPDTVLPDDDTLAGYIFTSANGVRALTERRPDRTLTAWCVGPATAAAARDDGFTRVEESRGNAADLADFIAAHSSPDEKPLLHVANADAAGGLKARLESFGFSILFAPIYQMLPARTLAADVDTVLNQGTRGIILIHSAKGAAAFADLTQGRPLEGWHAVVISQKAGAALSTLPLASLHFATNPDEDGLLAALDIALATLSA